MKKIKFDIDELVRINPAETYRTIEEKLILLILEISKNKKCKIITNGNIASSLNNVKYCKHYKFTIDIINEYKYLRIKNVVIYVDHCMSWSDNKIIFPVNIRHNKIKKLLDLPYEEETNIYVIDNNSVLL